MSGAPGPGHRGFTLLELLIVMVLLSVVLAMAAPSFGRSYRSLVLDHRARQLRSFLQYGRELATAEGVTHRVRLTGSRDRIELLRERTVLQRSVGGTRHFSPRPDPRSRMELGPDAPIVEVSIDGRPVPLGLPAEFDLAPLFSESDAALTMGAGEERRTVRVAAGSGRVVIR